MRLEVLLYFLFGIRKSSSGFASGSGRSQGRARAKPNNLRGEGTGAASTSILVVVLVNFLEMTGLRLSVDLFIIRY